MLLVSHPLSTIIITPLTLEYVPGAGLVILGKLMNL